jgi:hypothetical protein
VTFPKALANSSLNGISSTMGMLPEQCGPVEGAICHKSMDSRSYRRNRTQKCVDIAHLNAASILPNNNDSYLIGGSTAGAQ